MKKNIKTKYIPSINYLSSKLITDYNINYINLLHNCSTLKIKDNLKAKMDLKLMNRDSLYSINENTIYTKNNTNKDYFRSLINMASSNGDNAGFYDGENFKLFNNMVINYILKESFFYNMEEDEIISKFYIDLLMELIGKEKFFTCFWNNDIDSLVNDKSIKDVNILYNLIYNIERVYKSIESNNKNAIELNKNLKNIFTTLYNDEAYLNKVNNAFYIIEDIIAMRENKKLK